jgi:hypothetical protein
MKTAALVPVLRNELTPEMAARVHNAMMRAAREAVHAEVKNHLSVHQVFPILSKIEDAVYMAVVKGNK